MRHAVLLIANAIVLSGTQARAQSLPPSNPLQDAIGAPANFTLRGTFRTRIEGIDGQFRPAPAPRDDMLLSFRTTLFAEYDAHDVRIGAELIDSRGYFERPQSTRGTTEINAFELGQAYLAFDLAGLFGSGAKSSITIGRFTQDVGSRRLIGRNQFRNTINAFTGVALDWQSAAKDTLRLFWTMPHTRLPTEPDRIRDNAVMLDRESADLQFFGGSFTKAGVLGGTLEVYGYGLNERDSARYPTRNRRLFIPGMRVARAAKPDTFDYDLEGVYQTGTARATAAPSDRTDLDVSAYFLHAEIGRTFKATWLPRIAIQYDRASGDGSSAGKFNRFDTLFGVRRGEFGPTSLYGAVQRANLSSPAVRLEVTPVKPWDGFVAYRALWLDTATDSFAATGIRDRAGKSGKFAGHQIEARARYWVIRNLARFDGGVAYLFKSRFLKDAPNAPDAGNTRYVYLDLNFIL